GDIRRILEIFVAHGSPENILYEAHPHIGTNKLPAIVAAIRESILQHGGEVHFNSKVTDFILKDQTVLGVRTWDDKEYLADAVLLATGHSARDIFELLDKKGILVEAKPFAMGVRVEHAQSFVDSNRYHQPERGNLLPAASYSLVTQTNYNQVQKGVFSFCMCPGGFIVPSATAPGEVVVNGMSPSRRDSKYANSGIVVSVELADMEHFAAYGALKGLAMQRALEQKACTMAGGTQAAPAQLLQDFVNKKISTNLLDTSYQPGLLSVDLNELFSPEMASRLRHGFLAFDKSMKGFVTNEAQIVGVESRTSSPVRIPRDSQTLEHVQIQRLFPCGEGGGFAGGIVSAAMDGERVADAIIGKLA
ncbi:MAG: FAD-binding protein, partial [Cytophagales bacterium]|nr:FAD-binding protein [Cytophagales bacterium]